MPIHGQTFISTTTIRNDKGGIRKSSRRSHLEQKLLGYDGNETDPDDVPIEAPVAKRKMSPVVSGGPKPTNTLRSGNGAAHGFLNTTFGHIVACAGAIKNITGLTTRSVTGANVSPSLSITKFNLADNEHPPKRRKVEHETDFHEVLNLDDSIDEPDVLGTPAPSPLSISQNSGANFLWAPPKRAVSEHRAVEKIMNSTTYAKQKKQKHAAQTYDLTQDNGIPNNVRYRGTARPSGERGQPVSKRRTDMGSEATKSSNLFTNVHHRKNDESTSHGRPPVSPRRRVDRIQPDGISLRKKSTLTRGEQQNCEPAMSSDELGGDTDMGDYAAVSRSSALKLSRPPSPLGTDRSSMMDHHPSMNTAGLEESNIKPTDFKRRPEPEFHGTRRSRQKQSPTLREFNAKSVSTGHSHFTGMSTCLLIDNTTTLDIICDNHNTGHKELVHQILISKMQKIAHSESYTRVFISKVGIDDTMTDIIWDGQKTCAEFMIRIQDLADVEFVKQPNEWMTKAFNNRSSQWRETPSHASTIGEDGPQDIDLIIRNKERRPQRMGDVKSSAMTPEQPALKRQRMNNTSAYGSNVGDSMDGYPDGPSAWPVRHTDARHSSSRNKFGEPRANINRQPNENIDCILARLNNTHNLRSKKGIGPFKPPTEITTLDDHMEDDRYSKRHDLGPKWKKPLLFPATGKKKTTVEHGDLERLDNGQFLNDNLISFYLRYLECNLENEKPAVAKKVYWFNTYFFASLTQSAKSRQKINYDAVRKWTRTVDLFSYDYAVLPINELAHWYVVIICNLPALAHSPEILVSDFPESPASSPRGAYGEANGYLAPSALEPGGVLESVDLDIVEVDKDEKAASDSFAELNLNDPTVGAHFVDSVEVYKGKGMLDKNKRKKNNYDGNIPDEEVEEISRKATERDSKEMSDVIKANISSAEKPKVSNKRGKRKSIPPMRVHNPDQPIILTLDSLDLPHPQTVRVLKDYLIEEAKDKRGGMQLDDGTIQGITAKKIPHQDNFCDCGLFLLGYIEKFKKAPKDFVTKILRREYDEKTDWPELDPTKMRTNIRELIQGLHASQEGLDPLRKQMPKGKDQESVHGNPAPKDALPIDEIRQTAGEMRQMTDVTKEELRSGAFVEANDLQQLPVISGCNATKGVSRHEDMSESSSGVLKQTSSPAASSSDSETATETSSPLADVPLIVSDSQVPLSGLQLASSSFTIEVPSRKGKPSQPVQEILETPSQSPVLDASERTARAFASQPVEKARSNKTTAYVVLEG